MQGNLLKYINAIISSLPAEIISAQNHTQLMDLAALFSDFTASEYIMESYLNSEDADVDFSFRVLTEEKAYLSNGFYEDSFAALAMDETWKRIIDFVDYWPQDINDIWLEIDYSEYAKQIPLPCFFFNGERILSNRDMDYSLLFASLMPLLGRAQVDLLKNKLIKVIQQLPPDVGLFQIGTMLARHRDRVRIFTAELSREQVVNYLSAIGWIGPLAQLNEIFNLIHGYSDGQYILDFDVNNSGISSKIGINFGLKNKQELPAFLDNLIAHRLCTDSKQRGVLNWPGSQGSFLGSDYGFTAIIKDISHFKVSYAPEEGIKVKAYLRFSGVYLKKMLAARKQQPNQAMAQTGMKTPGCQEMQDIMKEVVRKSMLDKEYRELCLKDSQAAIQAVIGNNTNLPANIIFLEKDQQEIPGDGWVYILPPYLKPSWLTSK